MLRYNCGKFKNIIVRKIANNEFSSRYSIYHKYSYRQAWASSVDADGTPQNAASHQGLHSLTLMQQFLDTMSASKLYLFKF